MASSGVPNWQTVPPPAGAGDYMIPAVNEKITCNEKKSMGKCQARSDPYFFLPIFTFLNSFRDKSWRGPPKHLKGYVCEYLYYISMYIYYI